MSSHSGRSIKKLYSRSVRALRTSNHSDALLLTQEIIERQADHPGAHAVQFSSLFKSKKFELARLIGNQAAELNPKSVFILNNQACLELEKNNPAPAAHLLNSLIEQYGERAQWVHNLAIAYDLSGQYEKAISLFRKTLDQEPTHTKAARQLAECLEKVGHFEEATQAYDYYRTINNSEAISHSQFIHCAAISDNISTISLEQELALWGDKFIPKNKHYDIEDISNKKQITIGFISTNLNYDWLKKIVIPVANKLAEKGDRIVFYQQGNLLALNENITNVNANTLSDANFARKVRSDEVDVLIDVCGMAKGNRQRALGLQLASKQYSWLAHEGVFATPLINSLDQLLDQVFITPANDTDSSEPWPEKTFAGLAGHHGLSYSVIKTWAAVLRYCPEWSLNIKTQSDSTSSAQQEQIEKLLWQRFSAAGVDRSRVTFNNQLQHDQTTIVLDNFVHNDPVELSESLLSGASVVSLEGKLFPAQHSAQLMRQFGIQEHLCENPFHFSQHATALALGKKEMHGIKNSKKHQSELNNVDAFVAKLRKEICS